MQRTVPRIRVGREERWRLLSFLLVASFVLGCSSQSDSTNRSAVLIASYSPSDSKDEAWDNANIAGTIQILDDGCLVINAIRGLSVVPVFPKSDVSLVSGGLVYLGVQYSEGEAIDFVGAEFETPLLDWDVPAECREVSRYWAVKPE